MPWKGGLGKNHEEALLGVRYVSDDTVDHAVRAIDKGFLRKPNPRVIEYPHIQVFIWCDDINGVHRQQWQTSRDLALQMLQPLGFPCAGNRGLNLQPCARTPGRVARIGSLGDDSLQLCAL